MSWYPHATRDEASLDGGLFATGYARRGVLHTTEGTSYAGARAAYAENLSWPHLTVSYETGRVQVWQHLPVTVAARALRNASGGVIQVEIVATADLARRGQPGGLLYVEDLPPAYLAGIARLMRWVEATCGVRRAAVTNWLPYPQSFGIDNGLRLSATDWRAVAGWLGHMHVPENTHGDPGNLPIHRLLHEDPMPDIPTLIQVVKDQTGAIYNQSNAHHGALITKLDALPAAIVEAFTAALTPPSPQEPPAQEEPAA